MNKTKKMDPWSKSNKNGIQTENLKFKFWINFLWNSTTKPTTENMKTKKNCGQLSTTELVFYFFTVKFWKNIIYLISLNGRMLIELFHQKEPEKSKNPDLNPKQFFWYNRMLATQQKSFKTIEIVKSNFFFVWSVYN